MQKNSEKFKEKKYIKIRDNFFVLYQQPLLLINTWLPFLIEPDTDKFPEYRNRIFCIMIYGLMDTIQGNPNRLRDIKNEASKANYLAILYYSELISLFFSSIESLMRIFSWQEMAYISLRRNQWVHGHLSDIQKEDQVIKFVSEKGLESKKIAKDIHSYELHKINEKNNNDVDEFLTELRLRFFKEPSLFWEVYLALRCFNFPGNIQQDIDKIEEYNIFGPRYTWDMRENFDNTIKERKHVLPRLIDLSIIPGWIQPPGLDVLYLEEFKKAERCQSCYSLSVLSTERGYHFDFIRD